MANLSTDASVQKSEGIDNHILALAALGWIVSDPVRAERLLALTGLTPGDLRDRIDDPALLAAVIAYLEAHEPDLIDCAEALGTTPIALIAIGKALG